ncbi:hypothetical protein GO755_24650 [Spirosoma sp. HMF4905]|uniref:Uncharacterized protein n=1 Tax=Spirosoma arboris TaxID=2682092 RepID=A0A7K1SHL9_9BACT|nr:hypothetical protein [Spirosoma arboris]MVM33253.1 hypothetical protein [Spirosoma arboris]
MTDLRLTPGILSLKQTPAEKLLLAYICQQAVLANGQCTDSNIVLAEALGMHHQTVSTLVTRLSEATLLETTTQASQANRRILMPIGELLAGYERLTHSTQSDYERFAHSTQADYERLTHSTSSDYPSKPDSTQPDYERITHSPARRCPITDIDITHQGENYPVVTAATIKRLYKTDRQQFEEVMTRLEVSAKNDSSMSGRCMSMALKVQALVDTYPADHFKKLALSQFLSAHRPKRLCPVTDVDITHQRPNCRFVTILTLKNLIRTDRPAFDQLVSRFLHRDQFSESVSMKTHLLAERVRQVGNTQV